jgi:uncharacterized protein YndB with AHSA1/START domain
MSIDPLVRSVEVRTPPEKSFDLFVRNIGQWWTPGKTLGAKPHVDIVIEPFPGGRWYERDSDGNETQWGKVIAYHPPTQLVLGWQITADWVFEPSFLTEVELTFAPIAGGGTLVTLEHRNLERFGRDAARVAEQIGQGWPARLGDYAAYANASAKVAGV